MIQGYFFDILNTQTLQYYYTPIQLKEKKGYLTDTPIIVELHKNEIKFIVNLFTKSPGEEWKSYSTEHLFVLPLSDLKQENLEQQLKIFSRKSDIEKKEKERKLKNIFQNSEDIYESRHSNIKNTLISYSSLKQIDIYRLPESDAQSAELSISTVFLDFLFDFFHSNVFQNNPHYETIRSKLETYPLTKALLAKLEYCYYKDRRAFTNGLVKRQQTYFDEQLKTATKNWLSLIRNKNYEKIIHPDNKWFEPVESEHFNVYYPYKEPNQKFSFINDIIKSGKLLFKKKGETFHYLASEAEDSVQWLLGRYHLWGAFLLQFGYIVKSWNMIATFIGTIAVTIMAFLGLYNDMLVTFGSTKDFMQQEILILDRLVKLISITLPLVFICFLIVVIIANIIYGIVCFLNSWINFTTPKKFKKDTYSKLEKTISAFFIFMCLLLTCNFFYVIPNCNLLTICLLTSLFFVGSLGIGNYLYCYLHLKKNIVFSQILPNRTFAEWLLSIPKLIQFFKLKILFASAAVWIFIFTSERFWNLDFKIDFLEKSIIIILFIGAFSFMASKFKHFLPIQDRTRQAGKIFIRGVFIILLGITYSLIIGVATMSFTAENILTKDDFLQNYFSDYYEGSILKTEYQNRLDNDARQGLDEILMNQDSIPKHINKQLFDSILPNLKHPTDTSRKVMYKFQSASNREIYIFPEMLIFYTIICLLIGIVAEMGFSRQE